LCTTDAQVRKLMEEMSRRGRVGMASMKAGMDRKTGRKYLKSGKLPSELRQPHTWRTRADPFELDWPDLVKRLEEAPELEAKSLFEHLMGCKPGQYQEGQLRTFQRKVREWRAMEGPPREVYFAQEHRPGEAMQTDFTHVTEFEVTIAGRPFVHMLCQVVLPYSNWEWATVCRSESMAAIRRGLQAAVFHLGRVPRFHQTDNSTAATHDLATGKRGFNKEYEELIGHLGMTPRTIKVGASNQNGDVEALQGVLKRRMKQHLLLRGSSDFDSVEDYETWIQDVLEKANTVRSNRISEDLDAMRPVKVSRLPEYKQEQVRVSTWSTIRVKHNAYSVPSRLIGQFVLVRSYEDRLEIFFKGQLQLAVERLIGRHGHHIDYRHVIWSLIRKPGAFARYRYQEDLFPTLAFRKAYDALHDAINREIEADIHYLRILHLAASTMESEVETALVLLLDEDRVPYIEEVKALVAPQAPEVPDMEPLQVDLHSYDVLLGHCAEVAS